MPSGDEARSKNAEDDDLDTHMYACMLGREGVGGRGCLLDVALDGTQALPPEPVDALRP